MVSNSGLLQLSFHVSGVPTTTYWPAIGRAVIIIRIKRTDFLRFISAKLFHLLIRNNFAEVKNSTIGVRPQWYCF